MHDPCHSRVRPSGSWPGAIFAERNRRSTHFDRSARAPNLERVPAIAHTQAAAGAQVCFVAAARLESGLAPWHSTHDWID